MKNWFFVVYFLVSYFDFGVSTFQCLDETGKPVDWYVLYKLPKLKNHPDSRIAHGIAYAYITPETIEQGWQLSEKTVLDPESFIGRSVSYLYSDETQNEVDDHFWLFYSDQPPNLPFIEKDGHTKGVVAGNSEGGFWLVHSLPRFPVVNVTTYEYPKTGIIYGQSFLCISMEQEVLDSVGNQIMTNCARVFNSSFTSELMQKYPSLVKAAKNERNTDKKRKEIIRSLENNQFLSFAKSNKFDADLYSDWVSDSLRSELYVETWLHDNKLPSACNETYRVYNVANVTITCATCEFGNFHDHSKYAVSANPNGSYWVCIGDINRASSQYFRGGGTVCMDNQQLWTAYHGMIAGVEQCPKVCSVHQEH